MKGRLSQQDLHLKDIEKKLIASSEKLISQKIIDEINFPPEKYINGITVYVTNVDRIW